MENSKLIDRIELGKSKELFYTTACLKVVNGLDFNEVYNSVLEFVKITIKEKGCVKFFAAPGNIGDNEIILWEVWENEVDANYHMEEKHTIDILSSNTLEFQWGKMATIKNKQ